MTWSSTAPLGSVSVKQNRSILGNNTTYIETTMGNDPVGTSTGTTKDHFWNVDASLDGHHRFIRSPAFTVGGNPANPGVGTSMDGVFYLKTILGRAEWFHRNVDNIFQVTPSFISGVVALADDTNFVTLTSVPASCYGEIFIWRNGTTRMQQATFISSGSVVEAYSFRQKQVGESDQYYVEFLNGSGAVDLNIKARLGDSGSSSPAGNYLYRITYRAV